MLSGLLKNDIAIQVSINIMNAFVEFKQKIFFDGQIYDAYSLIIDNKELYHCGASLKDLGKKCFAISKIEDMEYVETNLKRAINWLSLVLKFLMYCSINYI